MPALLFENVLGYPGKRIFCGELGPTRPVTQGRIAFAMGMPKTDCTFPMEWPEGYRRDHAPVTFGLDYPAELQERVKQRWETLGLPPIATYMFCEAMGIRGVFA